MSLALTPPPVLASAPSSGQVVAVIVAAGQGRRMGGPKALALWQNGQTLAVAHARASLAAGCSAAYVVARREIAERLGSALPAGARWVVSRAADALGPAGSIAACVEQHGLDRGEGAIALSPVDVDPRAWASLSALRAALDQHPAAAAARPVHQGQGGHPALVRASVLVAYRHPLPRPLRELLQGRRLDVAVDEPAVITDLDTPEALSLARACSGR